MLPSVVGEYSRLGPNRQMQGGFAGSACACKVVFGVYQPRPACLPLAADGRIKRLVDVSAPNFNPCKSAPESTAVILSTRILGYYPLFKLRKVDQACPRWFQKHSSVQKSLEDIGNESERIRYFVDGFGRDIYVTGSWLCRYKVSPHGIS